MGWSGGSRAARMTGSTAVILMPRSSLRIPPPPTPPSPSAAHPGLVATTGLRAQTQAEVDADAPVCGHHRAGHVAVQGREEEGHQISPLPRGAQALHRERARLIPKMLITAEG